MSEQLSEKCATLPADAAAQELGMTKTSLMTLVRLFLLPSIPPYDEVENKQEVQFNFCRSELEKFKD